MRTNRRRFLKQTAATGATLSAPMIWTRNRAWGEDANSAKTVAAIGVGGSRGRYSQGGSIARSAANHADMIAVCDVDDRHTAEFSDWSEKKHHRKLTKYRDYREMLSQEKPDIVTIGTPDHWHVPIALAALESGCDVYCEKPLTLTIDEGKQVREAVKRTGKVFQVGTQQRSSNDRRFLKAIAMVKSGRIGKNVNAYVAIGGAPADGPFESQTAPDDLDWNMWVGPAQKAKYCEQRRRFFRWYFDYSGGKMTDWGAHHIDIAQWALGCDETGPTQVSGKGTFPPSIPDRFNWNAYFNGDASLPNAYNTATEFNIDLSFANGSIINVNHFYDRDESTKFGNGILFEGDEGRIFVNRGKLTGAPVDDLTESDNQELDDLIREIYKGREPGDHMRNFFESIEDRAQPISDVETHHRTMTSCHLCNIALMLGRDLTWDPDAEDFVGDEQATALMTRPSREGFALQPA